MALLGNQATLKPGKRQETAAMTHRLRSRNQKSGNELIYAFNSGTFVVDTFPKKLHLLISMKN